MTYGVTGEGNIHWDRLEGLLDHAKDTQGYKVTGVLEELTDYLIPDDGEQLLNDLYPPPSLRYRIRLRASRR